MTKAPLETERAPIQTALRDESTPSPACLNALPWDTEHFGFPVARLTGHMAGQAELCEALQRGRAAGFRLIYWSAPRAWPVSEEILTEWSGQLVDVKVTYVLDLSAAETRNGPQIGRLIQDGPVRIAEYPQGDANRELLALGVTAGRWSRFARDERILQERFRALYERWIQRSTTRELADAVLVAQTWDGPQCGLVTLSVRDRQGSIPLIAVNEAYQGRGIGSLLMAAARRWLTDAGADTIQVVTQQANVPACTLYERQGYTLVEAVEVYHFWNEARTSPEKP